LVGQDKVPTGGFANTDTGGWKQRLVMRLRTHLFLPDPRIGWKPFALRRAKAIIREHGIKTIITTGPPASVHLIGRALRRRLGVRWIADFRDPWTDIFYYPLLLHSRWSDRRNKQLERSVLLEADQLVTVSEGFRDLLLAHVPERPAAATSIIPNGYDPRDFAGSVTLPAAEGFTIGYTGTMSDQYAPTSFFLALAAVIGQCPAANIRLEVPLVALGMVPHDRVTAYQRRADLLLLVVPDESGARGIFPAKVFEYLAAGPPILSLGVATAEVGRVVTTAGRGHHFHRGQVLEMTEFLLAAVGGTLRLAPDTAVIATYSRAKQAARFRELL
jgi:glycosyltransferase involved in cell wall biosynthesis